MSQKSDVYFFIELREILPQNKIIIKDNIKWKNLGKSKGSHRPL